MDTAYHPSGEELRLARDRVKPWIYMTPLLRAEGLERHGRRVFIKPENLQRTGSFKVRGAFNALVSMSAEARARGIVAYSSGNHGAAVAFAARELGVHDRGAPYPCTIVVPENAMPAKVEKIKALGAEVVVAGDTTEDRRKAAVELAQATGREVLPSYDDPRIICGQGTLGAEIMDQWMGFPSRTRRLYAVAAPVGGGGLLAGVSASLRARGFGGRIVGIEPEGADDTRQSLARGERVAIPPPLTICDGLRSLTPGEITFPILQKCIEGVLTVSDEQVMQAVAWLLGEQKLLVEPSGAVAVAAWLNGLLDDPAHDPQSPEYAGDVVLLVSGGNMDAALAVSWMEQR